MINDEKIYTIRVAVGRRHVLGLLVLTALAAAARGIASETASSTMPPPSPSPVAGGVQIGDDAGACTAAKNGTLRWHGGALQACLGSAWGPVARATYTFADIGYLADGAACLVANTGTGKCSCPTGTNDFTLQYTNYDSNQDIHSVYFRRGGGVKKEPVVCLPTLF